MNSRNNIQSETEAHRLALNVYLETLKLKNYSDNTIKNYRSHFIPFLSFYPEKKPSQISRKEIIEYLLQIREKKNWSASEQNQVINSIKFFYEKVLNRPKQVYELPRAKKSFQLPGIFSADEVKKIIDVTDNLKHKSMLCLAYAGGLRVSEIVNLKIQDIDSQRMVINLRQGKGRKDRIVMLSEKLLKMLREYFKNYKPKVYLFEGQFGSQYSARSIQAILKNSKFKAGIKKKGSVHSLRHSFATHLLEGGTDILSIKKLLGHNSLRTTMIYTHVSKEHISKIQSPLDKIL